ncbi:MAG: hypothetical protein PWP23_1946 [Candidatus Sumerlaeota bacterium]|nr:hypothetical protein [Candidatus Sumerlaeota bacterium]
MAGTRFFAWHGARGAGTVRITGWEFRERMARKTRKGSGSREAVRQQAAASTPPHVEAPAAVPLTVPTVLSKFVELSLLASFIGAVIAYHLSFPENWLVKLSNLMMRLNGGEPVVYGSNPLAVFIQDFSPFISQGLPVLELKTTVWLLAGLFLLASHLLARLYEAFFRVAVLPPQGDSLARRRNWYRIVPIGCLLAYLVFSLVSFSGLGWAPKPPLDALPIAPAVEAAAGDSLLARVGALFSPTGAGTYHSWTAWVQLLGGLLFFLVAEDVIRTRRLVYKILGLILGLGVIAAFVAVLAHAKLPGLSTIWVKWGPSNYRNDVAGFIGHNTALSSFLMAPMLLAWTLLMAHGSRMPKWGKVLIGAAMTIMAVALIMAQSRAVIPILFVAFVALLFLLARRAALRPIMAFWVAIPLVLAVLILSQFIHHPANPFYRENLPLAVRLQHMSPDHLKTETRLRILTCSLPVVGRNFLAGTGFGSFHYVYPQAQGEYYVAHPDSWIAPTANKTFRAHNEYLQTLFETGIVGLGLALAAVIAILLSGWRAVSRSFRQRHIALQIAILLSIGALLLHCFVDFPLRVPPLAATLLLLLAMWSAGERLWPIEVKPLDERTPENPDPPSFDGIFSTPAREEKPDPRGKSRGARSFILAVVWIALVPAAATGIVVIGAQACEWFAANTLNLRAQSSLDIYMESAAGEGAPNTAYIFQGHQSLIDARRLLPLFGEPYYYGARILYAAAGEIDRERIAAIRNGHEQAATELRRRVRVTCEDSQQLLNRSLSEFRFHGSYHQRAITNYTLYRVTDGRERNAYLAAALDDLEQGVMMNPGDPEMIRTLIEWKERYDAAREGELEDLHRLLYHFHKPYFNKTILQDALTIRALLDYRTAFERMAMLVRIDPANLTFKEYYASTAVLLGDLGTARELSEELTLQESPTGPAVEALIAARERQFDRAAAALDHPLLNQDGRPRQYRGMLRRMVAAAEARERGDSDNARREYDALLEFGNAQPEMLVEIALHLEAIFDDPQTAAEFARARIAIQDPPARSNPFVILGETALAGFKPDVAKLIAKREAALEANQPAPTLDDPALRRAIEQAVEAYGQARERAKARQEILTINRRFNELRSLLDEPENSE